MRKGFKEFVYCMLGAMIAFIGVGSLFSWQITLLILAGIVSSVIVSGILVFLALYMSRIRGIEDWRTCLWQMGFLTLIEEGESRNKPIDK